MVQTEIDSRPIVRSLAARLREWIQSHDEQERRLDLSARVSHLLATPENQGLIARLHEGRPSAEQEEVISQLENEVNAAVVDSLRRESSLGQIVQEHDADSATLFQARVVAGWAWVRVELLTILTWLEASIILGVAPALGATVWWHISFYDLNFFVDAIHASFGWALFTYLVSGVYSIRVAVQRVQRASHVHPWYLWPAVIAAYLLIALAFFSLLAYLYSRDSVASTLAISLWSTLVAALALLLYIGYRLLGAIFESRKMAAEEELEQQQANHGAILIDLEQRGDDVLIQLISNSINDLRSRLGVAGPDPWAPIGRGGRSQMFEQSEMDLSDYVDIQVESDEGSYLDNAGPGARAVHDRTGSEERTRPLVASTFWQSYVSSDAFERDLAYNGMQTAVLGEGEPLVVHHGFERYTLLLSSRQLTDPRSFVVDPTEAELREGWARANRRRLESARDLPANAPDPRHIQEALALMPQVAIEAYQSQRFYLLVIPRVEEELTTIPSPALTVDAAGIGMSSCTAGAIVQDSVGRIGVTAAAHAVPPGSQVTVNGTPATVVARVDDDKYDCCFVEMPTIAASASRSTHGPLRLAPRMNQPVNFERIARGLVTTAVRGFNLELPYFDPHLQQTVRTGWVTVRGDSGSALVDEDDYILGFAHSRSAANAPVTYSSWIWADAVFQKLGLTIY